MFWKKPQSKALQPPCKLVAVEELVHDTYTHRSVTIL